MIPAGAFYYPPPPQPFANPAMPAVPALPYAPAACYPAVLMQAPAAWYYPYPAAVRMQAPPPQPPPPPPRRVPVHAVWADNLDVARHDIRYFAAHARCVAVKVHYPGVVVHGAGSLTPEKRYAVLKANVDALKPLQVGLAVLTDGGRAAAWEFNLSDFNPAADPHAAGSLAYLQGLG